MMQSQVKRKNASYSDALTEVLPASRRSALHRLQEPGLNSVNRTHVVWLMLTFGSQRE